MVDGPSMRSLREELVARIQRSGRDNKKDLHPTLWNFAENIHKGSAIRVSIDPDPSPKKLELSVFSVLNEAKKHNKSEDEVMAAFEQTLKEPPVRK